MSTKRPLPESSSSSESEYTDEEEDSDTEEKAAMVQTAGNSKEDNKYEKKKQESEDDEEEDEEHEDEDEEDGDEDEDDVHEASVPKPKFPNSKVQDEASSSDDYESDSGSGSESDESSDSPDMSTLEKRASTKKLQNIKLAKQDHNEERPAKKVKMEQAGDLRQKAGVRVQQGNVAGRAKLPEQEAVSDTMNKKAVKDKSISLQNGGMSDERVKAQMRDKPEEASHKGTPSVKRTDDASDVTKKSGEQKHEEKSFKNSESEMPVSPQKSKHWTPQEEIVLSTALVNDMVGNEIPNKKIDSYWSKLSQKLQGKLENEWQPEQLCEKVKRMKTRYSGMADKMKGLATPYTFRNKTDPVLFVLWTQLWGTIGDHNQDVVAGGEDTVKKLSRGLDNSKGVDKLKTKRVGTQGVEAEKPAVQESNEAANALMEVNSVPSFPHKGTGDEAEHSKEEVYAVLAGLQECTQKVLYEWQKKATLIIDNALKTVAQQSTAIGGVCPPGIGGLTNLAQFTSLVAELSCPTDKALQKEWSELRYQELNLYLKKLQLMQKECELKMQQLRSQPDRDESCGQFCLV